MENIKDINKVYLINWNKYLDFNNIKIKDLISKIQNDDIFIFIDDTDINIINFLKVNSQKKYILVYPIYVAELKHNHNDKKSFLEIIDKYLDEQTTIIKEILPITNFNIRLIFSTMDYFNGYRKRNITNRLIYNPVNHYLIVPMIDKEDFIQYILHNKEASYIKNKKNVISKAYPLSTHYSYYHCYNSNPKHNIIALSGKTEAKFYPERNILNNHSKGILKNKLNCIPYNWNFRYNKNFTEYIDVLSNYICCFTSGHARTFRKSTILHKFIEILSSGSLLLTSDRDSSMLKKLGFQDNINCMFVNVNNPSELIKKIDFILDLKNRHIINQIRKKGYQHAIEVFSSEKKFEEFSQLIENIKESP